LFRFLHAADLHLDSPLRGLERYEDAPVEEVRGAPRRALENLVQLALDEGVDFVLLAGDLYDGDWRDYNTGLFFVSQMRRLEQAGIPVHLVSGNHDAASQITKSLRLPDNVFRYQQTKPQTLELPELGVAIHGQSFATRSVTRDLAAEFPEGDAARFDIGLLHTSLDGRPGHDDYAPSHPDTLRSKGYDYWALGHVHEREIVSEDPWIVFPGNLQGRHARETGAKGCSLVTVENGALVAPPEHRSLDAVRWAELQVDLEGVGNGEETIDRVREALEAASDAAEGRLLAARIVLRGRTPAHAELVRDGERWIQEYRAQASGLGEPGVWLEEVRFETRHEHDLPRAMERDDALGDLIRLIAGLEEDVPALEEIARGFGDLARKLPVEIRSGEEPLDPTDVEALRQRLPAVRELLLGRLLDVGEGG
jgi:DNA repair exonuclease SbcCD nuclease subunit